LTSAAFCCVPWSMRETASPICATPRLLLCLTALPALAGCGNPDGAAAGAAGPATPTVPGRAGTARGVSRRRRILHPPTAQLPREKP